jgi:hypothetical protein
LYTIYHNEIAAIYDVVDKRIQNIIDTSVKNGVKLTPLQFAKDVSQNRISNRADLASHAGHYIGNHTMAEWYTIYESQYRATERTTGRKTPITKPIPQPIPQQWGDVSYGNLGYKSKLKRKYIMNVLNINPADVPALRTTVNSFPIKDNMKQYGLKSCYKQGTYIVDFMFETRVITYLVCINANTRYLYVVNTNITTKENDTGVVSIMPNDSKTISAYIEALKHIMSKAITYPTGFPKIKYLRGDGESAFKATTPTGRLTETGRFYRDNHIVWEDIPRYKPTEYPAFMEYQNSKNNSTTPNHTSLSIIDRVIRTIRDLAYNMKVGQITPPIMDKIVMLYNNAPHRGLSQIMKFVVSPTMADNDVELEREIIRRQMIMNDNIINSDGFMLPVGTKVEMYNEKDAMSKRRTMSKPYTYTVNGFHGGFYELQAPDGKTTLTARSKIKPL